MSSLARASVVEDEQVSWSQQYRQISDLPVSEARLTRQCAIGERRRAARLDDRRSLRSRQREIVKA